MSSNRPLLVTQSLLSDFAWVFRKDDGYDDFLRTLRREDKPTTDAMRDGREFEALVQAYAEGARLHEGHAWERVICEVGDECAGGQFQVRLSRGITLDGVDYLCYGVLDCLKAGRIIDTKYSKTYEVGKYLDSPQHPMYLYLCPEAYEFAYLISDGSWVYRERYTPGITEPISTYIRDFARWVRQQGLWDIYVNNWQSRQEEGAQ